MAFESVTFWPSLAPSPVARLGRWMARFSSRNEGAPGRSRRRRRTPSPGRSTLVAVAVATALVALWRHAARDVWPVAGLTALNGERPLWIAPRVGPLGAAGDLEAADVIIVGDSRVGHALHLSTANSAGHARFAAIWGGAAKTADALRALDGRPPRAVVVALSPLGLVGQANAQVLESLRERNPAFEPSNPPHIVDAWARTERAHLEGIGVPAQSAEAAVRWWLAAYRGQRAAFLRDQRVFDTAGFDRRLAFRLDRARSLALNPVEPVEWQRAWWTAAEPRASDRLYTSIVAPARASEREDGARMLEQRLTALCERGWRVACVRLPIDPTLRAIEDSTGSGELLRALVDGAAVPYLDFGAWPDAAGDGSHLNWPAADRATHALVRWLAVDLGWIPAR